MMSDAVKIQAILALCSFLTAAVGSVSTYLLARLNRDQAKRAVVTNAKTDAVRDALVASNTETSARMGDLATRVEQTHSLVNGKMAAQLALNLELARRLAELTHSAADRLAAERAEAMLKAHKDDEAKAQAGKPPEPGPGPGPA